MNKNAYASADDPSQRLHEPRMVLIVEDDCALRELFTLILKHQGYQVMSAANAQEALATVEAWRGEPIDLLMTDLSMPSMNGDDLAVQLCALLPELKVIYISGYAADDPYPVSLDLHNAIYLPKPVGPRAVQRAIQALFRAEPAAAAI